MPAGATKKIMFGGGYSKVHKLSVLLKGHC